MRWLGSLIAVFLVPPCTSILGGGGDWHVADGVVFSWHETWTAPALLVAVTGVLVVGPRPGAREAVRGRFFVWLGLLCAAAATLVLWTGGGRLGFVSFRSPEASAGLALISIATGLLLGRKAAGFRPAGVPAVAIGALAGIALLLGLRAVDTSRLRAAIEASGGRGPAHPGPDIVWIVVDTLRADAIGTYRERSRRSASDVAASKPIAAATPFLDRLASRGVVFERVIAPAPWTLPSMLASFSARWPSTLDPATRGAPQSADRLVGFAPGTATWVGRLREAGYHTAGFQKNPFLNAATGFTAPFDLYREVGGDRAERESAAQLVRAVLRWGDVLSRARRETRDERRPYLVYVHFMDPHVDYRAPSAWWSEAARRYEGPMDGSAERLHLAIARGNGITGPDRDQLARLYAAEVAYLDRQLERLVGGLADLDLLDDETLLVVSADHGEQLGEHGGWEHGDVYRENVRVPLIMAGAGLAPGRIARPISGIDLGPTVLDLVGAAPLDRVDGRSRLPGSTPAMHPDEPIFTEYGKSVRLESGRWVLIRRGDGSIRLFDGEDDPGESTDLAAERPGIVRALVSVLERHESRGVTRPSTRAVVAPDAMREELRALGYAK